MMLCYRILLLFAVFSMVIVMFNVLLDAIILFIFKKIWFVNDIKHFCVKVRLISKKPVHLLFCASGFFKLRVPLASGGFPPHHMVLIGVAFGDTF